MSEKTELTAADLALYLGCECRLFNIINGVLEYERDGTLCGIRQQNIHQNGVLVNVKSEHGRIMELAYLYCEVKPILRPLSDMTEQELLEFAKICSGANEFEIEKAVATNYKRVRCLFFDAGLLGEEWLMVSDSGETWYTSYFDQNEVGGGRNIINQHQQTVWLLSKHFDLFGWIPAGLALDKTKIQ